MDVKQYYRKIKETEETLTEKYPVVVSIETADGGRPGMFSEVSRAVAAKLIVEGRAVLASPDERQHYFELQAAARKLAEKNEFAKRVQVAIISEADLKAGEFPKRTTEPSESK